jgi:hypothetical protein
MKSLSRYCVALGLALAALSTFPLAEAARATRPTSAIVEALNGLVRMRSRDDGQSSAVQPYAELPINTILQVPGTRRGGMEHWAHLRFKNGSSRSLTLVQAGTDPTDTEYRFPCEYQQGTGLWGLRQVGSNACERITVNVGGWRSQGQSAVLAQTPTDQLLRYLKTIIPTSIAQQISGQLSITPANTLSLIYIYQTADGVVVNVLTGSATIRSTAGATIVRGGVQYIDSGDGRRGKTAPIPQEVYNARAVAIFLDPNNWANGTQRQIVEFQDAVSRQRAVSVPQPGNDPGPVWLPPPSNPITPDPRIPTDTDSTTDEPPDSRPDPGPDPDRPSDSITPSDAIIDYGDYVRPSPSTPPVIR